MKGTDRKLCYLLRTYLREVENKKQKYEKGRVQHDSNREGDVLGAFSKA